MIKMEKRAVEMVFGVLVNNCLPEIKPFIMALCQYVDMANVKMINFVEELKACPTAFGSYDHDAEAIVVALRPSIEEMANFVENNDRVTLSLRGYWLLGLMNTIVHEALHAMGKSHPNGEDKFNDEVQQIITEILMEYNTTPKFWSSYINEHIAGMLSGPVEEGTDSYNNLVYMEENRVWYKDDEYEVEELKEFFRITSVDPNNSRWYDARTVITDEVKQEVSTVTKSVSIDVPPPPAAIVIEQASIIDVPPPPAEIVVPDAPAATVIEYAEEEGPEEPSEYSVEARERNAVVYEDDTPAVTTPASTANGWTPLYGPKSAPTTVSLSIPSMDKATQQRMVETVISRMFNHIFSKCGFTNTGTGFTNATAVIEPMFLGDMSGLSEIILTNTHGTEGAYKTEPVTSSMKGQVFSKTGLPAFTFTINRNGVKRTWKLIPQNINAMKDGVLTKGAQMARNGAMMAWLYNEEGIIASVKSEAGKGYTFRWDPFGGAKI